MTTLLTPRLVSSNRGSSIDDSMRTPVLADIRFNMLGEVEVSDELEYHNSPVSPFYSGSPSSEVFKIAEIVSLPIDINERPLSKQHNSYAGGRPVSIRTYDIGSDHRSSTYDRSLTSTRGRTVDSSRYRGNTVPKIDHVANVDVLNVNCTRDCDPEFLQPRHNPGILRNMGRYYSILESVVRYQFPSVTDMKLISYPTTRDRSGDYEKNLSPTHEDLASYQFTSKTDVTSDRRGAISSIYYPYHRRHSTYHGSQRSYRGSIDDRSEESTYSAHNKGVPSQDDEHSIDSISSILSSRDDLRNMLQLIMVDSVRDEGEVDDKIVGDIRQVDPIQSIRDDNSIGNNSPITMEEPETPVRSILRPPRSSHAEDVEHNYDASVVIDIASQRDRHEIYENVLGILRR